MLLSTANGPRCVDTGVLFLCYREVIFMYLFLKMSIKRKEGESSVNGSSGSWLNACASRLTVSVKSLVGLSICFNGRGAGFVFSETWKALGECKWEAALAPAFPPPPTSNVVLAGVLESYIAHKFFTSTGVCVCVCVSAVPAYENWWSRQGNATICWTNFLNPCSCYVIGSTARAAYFINFLLKLWHVIIKLNCDTLYYTLGLRDRHRIKKTISRHF